MRDIIILSLGIGLIVVLVAWFTYGLLVIWLATRGWHRTTWNDATKWPFFFREWEKRSLKTKKTLIRVSTFRDALQTERTWK